MSANPGDGGGIGGPRVRGAESTAAIPVGTAAGLVGRASELARLGQFIDLVEHGGTAVAVRGGPGMGKSSMLRAAAELADDAGCDVLELVGLETESGWPFAGLHHLLAPVLDEIDSLPAVQRRALLAVLGSVEGDPPEVFLVALAALSLVIARARRRPIVIVVDELQWLDAATAEVLAFIARGIQRHAVVMVGAHRSDCTVAFWSAAAHNVELTPLDDASSRELLGRCGIELDAGETRSILELAAGNPLALVELPSLWREAAPTSTTGSGFSLPFTARLERAFAAHIEEMPSTARDALLVAAVAADDDVVEILAGASVLAGLAVTATVLEPAERAHLVRVDEHSVRFVHPLIRSAVVLHESVTRRHAAHAALAEVLRANPHRRSWHLAYGVLGPDDALADALEAGHHESIRRGSLDEAIAGLERSAQLSADPQRRIRRRLVAAQLALGIGRANLAERLITIAELDRLSELDRARVEWLREIGNDHALHDPTAMLELCARAEDASAAGEVDLAVELLLTAALRSFWTESGAQPRARVVEIAARLDSVQDDPRCIAAIAIAEPLARGTQTIDRLSRIRIETVTDGNHLRLLGIAARAVGAEAQAADLLGRAATALRRQCRWSQLAEVLAGQSAAWIELGDWSRALASMEEAQRLAEDTQQPIWLVSANALAGRLAGLTGNVDEAVRRAAAVELAASQHPNNLMLAKAQLARGFAWLSAGRHAEAYAAFRPLFEPTDPRHHPREQFCGLMFLAEAALRCDQRDDAREVMHRMEELATVTRAPLLHMQLLYARAVLADPADAEARFTDGLAHDLTRWPWVRARLQLAFGSWLRRQRRVAECRDHLRSAAATFELIGASAWVQEATTELRAAGGLGATRSTSAAARALSPQELEIARLAAQGLSNREIGERLYLSPRTVGSHLYRIYPKLGIRTRAQLASRLTDDPVRVEAPAFAEQVQRRVRRPERLAAVRAVELLDSPAETPFDTLSALTAELMDAPYAFVTIVDDARSFWKSSFGEVGGARQNAVGDSFCQYVIGVDGPLLIGDVRLDDRTASNPSIESMGVVAWAGHPIRDADGEVLGTICVVDTRAREWTAAHARTLRVMAAAVAAEITATAS